MAKSTGTMFGWCMDSKHQSCIATFKSFHMGVKKVRRKEVQTVVYGDELECACQCHRSKEK